MYIHNTLSRYTKSARAVCVGIRIFQLKEIIQKPSGLTKLSISIKKMTVFTQNMGSARDCDFARFFWKMLIMAWNVPKIIFRKKLLPRTDVRVYRNDNDFDHEKFDMNNIDFSLWRYQLTTILGWRAPAKIFSLIPRSTRPSSLVAATKSGTNYLGPSGYRWAQHHHSNPEATELLRKWIHSPTVDASQTPSSIRYNKHAQIHVTLTSALQQVDHRTSERKRWWFNLFCLFHGSWIIRHCSCKGHDYFATFKNFSPSVTKIGPCIFTIH